MGKSSININNLFMRAVSKYQRFITKHLYCRMVQINSTVPIISFSFDDAPRTAFTHGGAILKDYGADATFYVSLGMLSADSPSGVIASQDDLRRAVEDGHELGCHTFDHKHPRETKTEVFVQSVLKNRQALSNILPGTVFSTLAYPLSGPTPSIKRSVGELFKCCRAGGQTFNCGTTDFNLLMAFFLDAWLGVTVDTIKRLIDKNAESRGWLIFATHDVTDHPSPYGCSKKFFQEVVAYAAQSGALLLPVGKACDHLQMKGNEIQSTPQS